ncbi:PEP-CTERM sorting domain-containing protein [Luteolibacter yonseiensis]|uniref:PEP-CTERM sorting domain-containing protein n=1 Tax=Luteolibacter yonseiensis TaxID=1144680 RepID=A0A934R3X4_9BACT|nr:PEP-CTERM sorting domain-containing protein [Luteolibacter yonseiensis]MBK1816402.1 PEP-CTERM sorting domain-containing protein [Luteolibacter yonseiensis]
MKNLPSLIVAAISLAAPSLASGASVIVNEINAAGTTTPGDWFELVVVGNGTAGSTVDMRGWSVRIDNAGTTNVGFFTLSNASYWSNVLAGTILTFHEDNTAGGGFDSAINTVNNFTTLGWAHTNIYIGDATYVNTSGPGYDGSFPIDQTNTQVAIFDASSALVFGPAGENHVGYVGSGVGSGEIFKLEANPSPSITLTSPYNDGSTSTFGAPNQWSSGANTQDFSAYIVPEPSSALLGCVALLGLARRRR